MSMGTFFKRRLIRLQPMVVMGSIVGAALFWFQKAPCYPAMEGVSVGALLLVMLLGCTLLPLPLKWDIRGWMEMHPLNGPSWSLYYEYIGNILYALFIRKFSKTALTVLVAIAACFTVHRCLTAPAGDIVGGWALNWEQQYVYWMNGLYEAFCIICIFPVIVSMGAGGRITGRRSAAVCKFLGDISYPVYITHYPLVYIYTAWAFNRQATLAEGLPYMLLTFVGAFALAYACLKLYDLPVRKWLTERFLKKK